MTDVEKKVVDELDAMRMLHNNARENLAFCKAQQWRVTNYTLLLFGAIVAMSRLPSLQMFFTILLIVLTAVLLCGSLVIVSILQCDQTNERHRICKVETDYFPPQYKEVAWGGIDPGLCPRRPSHLFIFSAFWTTIMAAGVISLWLLIQQLCATW
jgi:hypothetical protein